MNTRTATVADRTVSRVGYGTLPLGHLHDRRGEAVVLCPAMRSTWTSTTRTPPSSTDSVSPAT